jgi:hypothetical protein
MAISVVPYQIDWSVQETNPPSFGQAGRLRLDSLQFEQRPLGIFHNHVVAISFPDYNTWQQTGLPRAKAPGQLQTR